MLTNEYATWVQCCKIYNKDQDSRNPSMAIWKVSHERFQDFFIQLDFDPIYLHSPSRFLNDNKGSPEVEEERVNATIEGEEGRMKVSIEDDQRALPAAQGISQGSSSSPFL